MHTDTTSATSAPEQDISRDPARKGHGECPNKPDISINPNLPSILDVLHEADRPRVIFVKPTLGERLSELYTTDSLITPAPRFFAVRLLFLRANECIPFHVSTLEKYYTFGGSGGVLVFLEEGGRIRKYLLNRIGSELFIRAGTPHALFCVHVGAPLVMSTIKIVLPRQNGETAWERATPELLENQHFAGEKI